MDAGAESPKDATPAEPPSAASPDPGPAPSLPPSPEGTPSGTGATSVPAETAVAAAAAPAAVRRSLLGRSKRLPRKARPHPYANELSTPEELAFDPKKVALFWLGLATLLTVAGLVLASNLSPHVPGGYLSKNGVGPNGWADWDLAIQVPLFSGLALLGFGFVAKPWAKTFTLAGWVLFAFFWALIAQDLFWLEHLDYINFLFALLGVYFFTYLAYHQWLSGLRRVDSHTVHFLNVATFVAAGAYFVIDKIEPIRRWLIVIVSDHTYWMLDLFGQGRSAGLIYHIDPNGSTNDLNANLAQFAYRDYACSAQFGLYNCTPPPVPDTFWAKIMHFDGNFFGSAGQDPIIVPVSIILACTALQSIMLFVGLFIATPSTWKRRLTASAVIAVVIYVLNLLRNTGIVWFYGQGQASFWMMHDAIGKGGSLAAFVVLAFAAFAWYPEFLKALIGVLDLPYRDGPLERALKLGKRRPEPPTQAVEAPAAASASSQ